MNNTTFSNDACMLLTPWLLQHNRTRHCFYPQRSFALPIVHHSYSRSYVVVERNAPTISFEVVPGRHLHFLERHVSNCWPDISFLDGVTEEARDAACGSLFIPIQYTSGARLLRCRFLKGKSETRTVHGLHKCRRLRKPPNQSALAALHGDRRQHHTRRRAQSLRQSAASVALRHGISTPTPL